MKVILGKYPGSKSKKERNMSIRIDPWDTWNMDQTLALLIVPMLTQLKAEKHGIPHTYISDAPEAFNEVDDTLPAEVLGESAPNSYSEPRWNWILDEMIWAFTQKIDSGEDSFYHNKDQLSIDFEKFEGSTTSKLKFDYQKDLDKPPYRVDHEGLNAYHDRMCNGFRLFGKYYNSLWD